MLLSNLLRTAASVSVPAALSKNSRLERWVEGDVLFNSLVSAHTARPPREMQPRISPLVSRIDMRRNRLRHDTRVLPTKSTSPTSSRRNHVSNSDRRPPPTRRETSIPSTTLAKFSVALTNQEPDFGTIARARPPPPRSGALVRDASIVSVCHGPDLCSNLNCSHYSDGAILLNTAILRVFTASLGPKLTQTLLTDRGLYRQTSRRQFLVETAGGGSAHEGGSTESDSAPQHEAIQ